VTPAATHYFLFSPLTEDNSMQQTSPILILGINRSGTTLLSMMLDAHSRIAIPHESHFFVSYYRDRASLDFSGEAGRLDVVRRILAEPFVRSWDRPVTADEVDLSRCHDLAATIDQVYRVGFTPATLARISGATRLRGTSPT
jgi:hypothetical protein